MDTGVTSTEFQNRAGLYIEQSGKNPVFITKHNRPVRVLIDIDEYNRLKEYDTRQALYAHELPDDIVSELDKGYQGKPTPGLDQLLD